MKKKLGRKPNKGQHVIQALTEYLEDTNYSEFAKSVGISSSHLSMILSGKRKASLKVTNRIIQETMLELTLKDMRPDIYKDIMEYSDIVKEKL